MLRRVAPALAFVCLAGGALRFATLDVQSLWFDETVTAQLLRMDLPGLLSAIPDSESSPPLYYVLAWLSSQLLGTGEVGLRSLPALLGTATIPVAWALGRRLGGDRAGLATAALVALNPMLVWFSQEARAYSLLALLGAVSALLWLRALEAPQTGRLVAWGVAAGLALATHYYAVFLVAPQALWLALRTPAARPRAAALAVPAAVAAALAPLALRQRSNDGAAFIGDTPLATRLVELPKQFLVGYDAPAESLLTIAAALPALAGIGGLAWLLAGRAQPAPPGRADALRLTLVTVAALALPVVAAVTGEDHLITRNLLAALPLIAALTAAGFAVAARSAPWPATAAVAAACALGLVAIGGVNRDAALQRDDWRGAARALLPAGGERVISATPASALIPLRYYLPDARPVAAAQATTGEIDYLSLPTRSPGQRPAPPRPAQDPVPAAGFAVAGRIEGQTFTVIRLRAAAPQLVPVAALATGLDGRPAAVLLTAVPRP